MTMYRVLALLAAGAGGGIAGTVASVASVVSYPALLALGAAILLLAPAAAFARAVPVLICAASVLVILQPRLRALSPGGGAERSKFRLAAMFGAAVYIGYFGAAGGVLLLAVLAASISESLIRINAIKNVVSGAANLVAAVLFALYAPVDWAFVPPLAIGFLAGGFTGQHLVRRLPVAALRVVVALAGLGLAVKLGVTAYR